MINDETIAGTVVLTQSSLASFSATGVRLIIIKPIITTSITIITNTIIINTVNIVFQVSDSLSLSHSYPVESLPLSPVMSPGDTNILVEILGDANI